MTNCFLGFRSHSLFFAFAVGILCGPVGAQKDRIVLPKNVIPTHYRIHIHPNLDKLTFKGSVDIDLKVIEATSTITLNAADLTFQKVTVSDVENPTVSFDEKQQTVTLRFTQPLKPADYRVSIAYSGLVYGSAAGLFALDYGSNKAPKRALYTQFENSDARRMFPGWDEPGIKTTFDFSATVPSKLMAVSNTPITSEKNLGSGLKTVVFSTTPKMSTYLLFFSLGDFKRVTNKVNGVELGVVVKRGDTQKAKYALDAATALLPFFEEYFGLKYPLPKLDMVAAPGRSQFFSAMENWGAILYFDRVLLIDSAISTEADRRRVFAIVAHEMAHQWFGNLVTMAWWDDLWLNEGFANWMENTATNHFHPEWKIWLEVQTEMEEAMDLDAKLGTHPVVQPILDVLQAGQAFDSITYKKGAAIIRMIETYVGADNFRAGVRSYMKRYQYANTVTNDLWQEIDDASPLKIGGIAHDFTLQAGIPLIDLKKSKAGWSLEQSRFSIDDSTPMDRSWRVPVESQGLSTNQIQKGIVSRKNPVIHKGSDESTVLVNAQRSGYYRVRYDSDSFAQILKHFPNLEASAQLGVINDTNALALNGYVPLANALNLLNQVSPTLDPLVLRAVIGSIHRLNYLLTDLPGQPQFQEFSRKKLRPILNTIGWKPTKTDDANTAQLRAVLLITLANINDNDVILQANAHFKAFLKNPNSLSPEIRAIVLPIVARYADSRRWQQLYTLAKNAKSVVEQQEYYELLGQSQNEAIAKKTLALALDKTTPKTFKAQLLREVAKQFPNLAFDFALDHHDWLTANLEPNALSIFVPRLILGTYDRLLIDKLESYAEKHIPKSARQETDKSIANIKYNAEIREKRIPELSTWLNSQSL